MAQTKLEILVELRDKASRELNQIERELKDLGGTSKKGSKKMKIFGKDLAAVGAIAGGAALAGFGALALGLKKSIELFGEQQAVEAQLNAVLKSTGQAAGLAADEVLEMASSLQKVTTFGDEAILSGQNMLLTFTNIGKDVFPAATETMLDMSQALGQDMKQSAIQLGKALNDPIQGVTALRRVGVQLTDTQADLVKSFVESGDVAAAQAVILEELQKEFGGSARAARETLPGAIQALKNSLSDFGESVGGLVGVQLTDLVNKLVELSDWFQTKLPASSDEMKNKLTELAALIDEKTGGEFTAMREEFMELVEVVKTQLIPLFIENKDVIIFLAKVILGTLVVGLRILFAALRTLFQLLQFVITGARAMATQFRVMANSVISNIQWVVDAFNHFKSSASSAGSGVVNALSPILNIVSRITSAVSSAAGRISSLRNSAGGISGVLRGAALGFSDGGVVPGTGNRDTVPAMLTPGEIVINPKKGQRMGSEVNITFNNANIRDEGDVEDLASRIKTILDRELDLVNKGVM